MIDDMLGKGLETGSGGVVSVGPLQQIEQEILLEVVSVHAGDGTAARQLLCFETDIANDARRHAVVTVLGLHDDFAIGQVAGAASRSPATGENSLEPRFECCLKPQKPLKFTLFQWLKERKIFEKVFAAAVNFHRRWSGLPWRRASVRMTKRG